MKYLLDTHVLLFWYLDDRALAKRYRRLLAELERKGDTVALSAITLWELAKLAERGRIQLAQAIDESLEQVEGNPTLEVLPITGRIAAESTRLGADFPRDPADQLIAATARCHGLILLTQDERIRDSRVVAVA